MKKTLLSIFCFTITFHSLGILAWGAKNSSSIEASSLYEDKQRLKLIPIMMIKAKEVISILLQEELNKMVFREISKNYEVEIFQPELDDHVEKISEDSRNPKVLEKDKNKQKLTLDPIMMIKAKEVISILLQEELGKIVFKELAMKSEIDTVLSIGTDDVSDDSEVERLLGTTKELIGKDSIDGEVSKTEDKVSKKIGEGQRSETFKVKIPKPTSSDPIAISVRVVNKVSRQEYGKRIWRSIDRGHHIVSGDGIRTGKQSLCFISFIDGTRVKMLESTEMRVNIQKDSITNKLNDKAASISLGKFFFSTKDNARKNFQFLSPTSTALVKKAKGSFASFKDRSAIIVLEGTAELKSIEGNKVFVQERQIGIATKGEAIIRDLTQGEFELESKISLENVFQGKNNILKTQKKDEKKVSYFNQKPNGIIIKIKDKNGNIITKTIRP